MISTNTIQSVVRTIATSAKPRKIVLFGSYAKGKPTEDRDLDLSAVKETNLPRHKRAREIHLLFNPYPCPSTSINFLSDNGSLLLVLSFVDKHQDTAKLPLSLSIYSPKFGEEPNFTHTQRKWGVLQESGWIFRRHWLKIPGTPARAVKARSASVRLRRRLRPGGHIPLPRCLLRNLPKAGPTRPSPSEKHPHRKCLGIF